MEIQAVLDELAAYLTANFSYSKELQAFWMAYQGAMAVRTGVNKSGTMHWFHAFAAGTCTAFGGALFTPFLMGNPTSMLSNDLNVFCCVVTFMIVNYLPFDLGFKFGQTLIGGAVIVIFAQMFRCMGIVSYLSVAHAAFKDSPSNLYPIPVVGPIMYATLLGNMGPFVMKGFAAHLQSGIPWPFQNGLFCATFFHFYVNDHDGPIGETLRGVVQSIPGIQMGLDDTTFATVVISAFMQIMGLLHLPQFFGPKFSPFWTIVDLIPTFSAPAVKQEPQPVKKKKKKKAKKED